MNKAYNGLRCVKVNRMLLCFLIGFAMTIGGCATTGAGAQPIVTSEVDPYESFNRQMFSFNDTVDNYIAEPISNAYKWITPQFLQTGVYNFFNNLKNINVVINDMLQAKFQQGFEDTGRFALNSTFGFGGLIDVAKDVGLEQNDEDFEQTLAVWGVPQGSYLVLPFLGPSTARGIPGTVFDTAANPVSYIGMPVQLVSMLNARANAEGALKFIDEAALDPYVFTRESFLQWRKSLANDGKTDVSLDLMDFEDDLDDGSDLASGDNSGDDSASVNNEIQQAANSFSSATQSFNDTAKSFEEASDKLDKLKRLRRFR